MFESSFAAHRLGLRWVLVKAPPPPRPNHLVVGTLAFVVLVVVFLLTQDRTIQAVADRASIDLAGQPVLGATDAPVTVAVFEDFECPNCRRFDEKVVPRIKEKFVVTGKVRYASLNVPRPLGEDSYTAAVVAECVYDQDRARFWSYKDTVYRRQKDEGSTCAVPSYLVELAEHAPGIDREALRECIDTNATRARVDADKQLGTRLGANATPTVFVNGEQVEARRFGDFLEAIDDAVEQ